VQPGQRLVFGAHSSEYMSLLTYQQPNGSRQGDKGKNVTPSACAHDACLCR
jgi:hypothetical protein